MATYFLRWWLLASNVYIYLSLQRGVKRYGSQFRFHWPIRRLSLATDLESAGINSANIKSTLDQQELEPIYQWKRYLVEFRGIFPSMRLTEFLDSFRFVYRNEYQVGVEFKTLPIVLIYPRQF
jgi:hypothetical protein